MSDWSQVDDYLGRVRGLRIILGDLLPPDAFINVDSLIEHGEPAEGLCQLAWVLNNNSVAVPPWAAAALRELTEGLVDAEFMPPGLGSYEP